MIKLRVFLAAVAFGCADPSSGGFVSAPTDARFEAPPQRIVTDVLEAVGAPPDAPAPSDVPARDAGADATGMDVASERPPPDAVGAADVGDAIDRPADVAIPGSCELLRQNCDRTSACYRSGGGATCQPAGLASEESPCFDDTACDRGLLCIDGFAGVAFCRRICDKTAAAPCIGRDQCRPLAGYGNAGTCTP